jgi:predicted dehydrogenase
MIQAAQKARCKLAVNHQMRWSPAVRAASSLIRQGFFGELIECSIQLQIHTG